MTASPIIRHSLSAAADPGDMLAALKGPAFAAYRRAFRLAEEGLRPSHPLHLDVDVTTACNFRCPMCPAGASGHFFPGFKKGLFLDRRLYRKALDEGAEFSLPSIRLGMTGEPLLVPDIDGWVAEAAAAGVQDISLITNGSLLTAEMSHRLIAAGLTHLMVSVDAGGPETYGRVRPGGDWPRLVRNLLDFLRVRGRLGSPTPLLRISFVEMSLNENDRAAFEKTFAPLADYLSFQKYLNILGGRDTDFNCDQSPTPPRGFCTEPFTRLALQADGGLFPCCADFGRARPLGNLTNGSLLATWNSEEALGLCGSEAADRSPCRECLNASMNASGGEIMENRPQPALGTER